MKLLDVTTADNIMRLHEIKDPNQRVDFYKFVMSGIPKTASISYAAYCFNIEPHRVAASMSKYMRNKKQGLPNYTADENCLFYTTDLIDAIIYW